MKKTKPTTITGVEAKCNKMDLVYSIFNFLNNALKKKTHPLLAEI